MKRTRKLRTARAFDGGCKEPAKNRATNAKIDAARKDTFPVSGSLSFGSGGDLNDEPAYASPPCFMHELDPSYLGYLCRDEVLSLLNQLMEGERAGAKGVAEMAKNAAESPRRAVLRDIAGDEARFSAMLSRHITRLGGTPSHKVGAFYGKLRAQDTEAEMLSLLDCGQRRVVDKIRKNLPLISDDALYRDLGTMLAVHECNIDKCVRLIR